MLCFQTAFSLCPSVRRRSSRSKNRVACQRPVLDPFDPVMMSFVEDEPPLTCDPETDWVTVKGNIARITDRVLKKYGDVQCKFMGSNGAQFCLIPFRRQLLETDVVVEKPPTPTPSFPPPPSPRRTFPYQTQSIFKQ